MKKKKLLRNYVFALMVAILLLQTGVFVAIFHASGLFQTLNQNAYGQLSGEINQRAMSLNGGLSFLAINTLIDAKTLNQDILDIAKEKNIPAKDLFRNTAAFNEASDSAFVYIENMLAEHPVSGAFYIASGSPEHQNSPNYYGGIYVKDTAVYETMPDNKDLVLRIGHQNRTDITINTDQQYQSEFNLFAPNVDYSFYTTTVEMAKLHPEASLTELAYWSEPLDMFGHGQKSIVYTVPLFDENKEVIGVFGVEATAEDLSRFLPMETELPFKDSFYTLCRVENNQVMNDWFITQGTKAGSYFSKATRSISLDMATAEDYTTTTEIAFENITSTTVMYCALTETFEFNKDTLYSPQKWYLLGVVPKGEMKTEESQKLILAGVLLLCGFAFVTLFTYLLAKHISNQFKYVAESVLQFEDAYAPGMHEAKFEEVDMVVQSVAKSNKSAREVSQRISNIIALTDTSIGCYEISGKSDYVFVTPSLLKILGIDTDPAFNSHITIEQWESITDGILQGADPLQQNVYSWKTKTDPPVQKWLQLDNAFSMDHYVGVLRDITDEIHKQNAIAYELDFDKLTRLYNNTAFKRRAFDKISQFPEEVGALIFVDLDNLKQMNDAYGHEVGDKFIIGAASMFHEFDKIGGIAARISGDEFAIFVHGFYDKETGKEILYNFIESNCRQSIVTPDGKLQQIRYSMGIAWYPQDATSISELVKYADYAMYEAKNNIKGTIFEFNKDNYEENAYIFEKREALNKLLDEKLIRFAFQPIVDINTGKVYGYEALMRSLMTEFQSPLEIIALATAQSKLYQLEKLTMDEVSVWMFENESKLVGKKLFLNTISSQTLNDEDFAIIVSKYQRFYEHYAVIEITEGPNMERKLEEKVAKFRDQLKATIAIDDFGSGYSNELRILTLNPEVIKIDMGFIRNIDKDMDKQLIVKNIVSYCSPRGILVLAEGVETEAELSMVMEIGIPLVQGYFFSKPNFNLYEMEQTKLNVLAELWAARARRAKE